MSICQKKTELVTFQRNNPFKTFPFWKITGEILEQESQNGFPIPSDQTKSTADAFFRLLDISMWTKSRQGMFLGQILEQEFCVWKMDGGYSCP